ncbi:MAG: type I restriction enzyme HsdR N-terminal domain-containing protein [Candidatus Gracilibacteria bacterium]|nr:type I restriction enzyme HsdR N-terminal domain-containing protein [Candidatus Gracilibacteria bacterium]
MIIDERTYMNLIAAILIEAGGFPEETLIREYKIKDKDNKVRFADFVVNINEPVAIIEVKKGKVNLTDARVQIKSLLDSFEKDIEGYLATFDENTKTSKFYIYNKTKNELEPINMIPSYEYFRSLRTLEIKENIKKSTNWLMVASLPMGIFSLIGAIYLVSHKISVENTQFYIYGLGILLILLPFYEKIKIAGVELEISKNKISSKKDQQGT